MTNAGFVICNNVCTSETFDRDIVPILYISKSLADYIYQVALAARPSLIYSNNDIKSAQTGKGFNVLQLISLPILHINNVLVGDTRRELDVTISDVAVVRSPSINSLSMLMSNSRVKVEMVRSNFLLDGVQNFLAGHKNAMNKDD